MHAQVDLVGGYYDAGDHVKFGLPIAFTVTMLSWSLLEYGADVADAGELAHALESIKWGTDYFIKAHTEPFVYWAEVQYSRTSFLDFFLSFHLLRGVRAVTGEVLFLPLARTTLGIGMDRSAERGIRHAVIAWCPCC